MVEYENVEEAVRFLTLGKRNIKKKAQSFVIEQGEAVEGKITEIKDSETYVKVFVLKVKDCPEPVIVTGKRNLIDKLGFGKISMTPVKEGDSIRLTWTGMYKTPKGNGYKFDVGIKRC